MRSSPALPASSQGPVVLTGPDVAAMRIKSRDGSQKVSLLPALCVGSGSGRGNGYGRNVGVTRSREPPVAGSLTAGSGRWVIRRVPSIRSRRDCRTGRHRGTRAVVLRRSLGLSRRASGREQQGCGRQNEDILCHEVSFLCKAWATHLLKTSCLRPVGSRRHNPKISLAPSFARLPRARAAMCATAPVAEVGAKSLDPHSALTRLALEVEELDARNSARNDWQKTVDCSCSSRDPPPPHVCEIKCAPALVPAIIDLVIRGNPVTRLLPLSAAQLDPAGHLLEARHQPAQAPQMKK